MLRLVTLRIGVAFATLVAVSIIVFATTEALPGDVANAVLGREATASLALIRERLGLDKPLPSRYGSWFWKMAHGNAGVSLSATAATTGGPGPCRRS